MPTIITRGAVSAKAYGFGASGGYAVRNSLRFRSSASAYLNRTPASNATSTTLTISTWVKRGTLGSTLVLIADGASSFTSNVYFNSSDQLVWQIGNQSSTNYSLITNAVYRDPAAWYHIVCVANTTNATSTNRLLLYVNGVQVTSFSSSSYPTQNFSGGWTTSFSWRISSNSSGNPFYYDGYQAEMNFIDGQALTPSSFGAYDTNGVWQPAKYTSTYGTNGFYLTFGNTTSTTTLGYDTSGNSNNWTTNNISLTAGSTYDSMTDSPTVTSASVANYAVLNPLAPSGGNRAALSNGNLKIAGNTLGIWGTYLSTIAVSSGKWYAEFTIAGGLYNSIGILAVNPIPSGYSSDNQYPGVFANGYSYQSDNGHTVHNNVSIVYGATFTTGDVIGVALDLTAGTLTYYKNNTSQGTAYTSLSGTFAFAVAVADSASVINVNFGQQPFTYTPPTGFNALNTYNLPTPTIANGALYMAATTYTGNSSTQSISDGGNNTIGTTFQPDFVWVKNRSSVSSHILVDAVRGAANVLVSNVTSAEQNLPNYVTSFNSNGFSVGTGSGGAVVDINQNGQSYIGWQWKAAGSTASNTNGSITSTVSANTTAGFSVVTYTGTGVAAATVGHGLSAAPQMIFTKMRSSSVANWNCWHTGISTNQVIYLNSTSAAATPGTGINWNPTSTTFRVDPDGGYGSNASGVTQVAYCWTPIAGYSAFGSYTGNGSTDGPFVFTNFRPRWLMIKNSSSSGDDWILFDSSRNTYNVTDLNLRPNTSAAESSQSANYLDLLSNGFKIRGTSAGTINASQTYIYAAFAENPFNYSRGR